MSATVTLAPGQSLCLVAAMDRQRGIGRGGRMPWHLPADLGHFRRLTMGHTVLMGRRTWETLPRALPGRHNIVLTSRRDYEAPGAHVCANLDAALEHAGAGAIMVIGGARVYRDCLPLAQRMELTLIDTEIEADTRFPSWDEREWEIAASRTHAADAQNPWDLTFISLRRMDGA